VQLPLLNSVPRVPLGRGLNLLDHYSMENNQNGKQEERQNNIWMRKLCCHSEVGCVPNVVACSKVDNVKQGAANGMDPEEVAPQDAT